MLDDVQSSGLCWKVLEPHSANPARSLLPLRFLAAMHRLVLEGRLPELARYYPSTGGISNPALAWQAFLDAIEQHGNEIRCGLPITVQTNEVMRCCALLPGFLEIAYSRGLPLRLLEIGCSAGLNLRWDRYRYEARQDAWGPADSPVKFDRVFVNKHLPCNAPVEIVERRGCDLNPVDPTSAGGRLTLLSFVWPDQIQRFRRLANAIEIARAVPVVVERSDAVGWLERELAIPTPGVITVVFHAIVLLYLSRQAREEVTNILNRAGERATARAPLAWLSMESGADQTDVHLKLWPGGERRRIATAGFHGDQVAIT